MRRYVIRSLVVRVLIRVGLGVLTLVLLSVVIFLAAQVLPGSPGRAILGNFASAESVARLDHQLGADRPVWERYGAWAVGVTRGDFGLSYQFRMPVIELLLPALERSLLLAAVSVSLLVPLALFGGVFAAYRRGDLFDRAVTFGGALLATLPEFVTGVVLIAIVGVQLRLLPIGATAPDGSDLLAQLRYLILPSIPLVLLFFGYIARITRASTIETLDSDYVRTAVLNGLRPSAVLVRHVLPNSMLPAVTAVGTQVGYLIGGLVVTETLFNYPGIGRLIFTAANQKDFPVLAAGVLVIGASYVISTLVVDITSIVLDPRQMAR